MYLSRYSGNVAGCLILVPVATSSGTPTLLPETAAELSVQAGQLKAQVLDLIARHFQSYPQPVNKPDHSGAALEYVALVEYAVTTSEESESYIIELRPEGFIFENPHGEKAAEGYGILPVEELLDLLRVLEQSAT